jgi:SAM-dependent methyltransferase
MPGPDFLDYVADYNAPAVLTAYDELPLWSAMFGLLLLDEVPMANVKTALDVACGTGFPLIELAERLGASAQVHGIDPWAGAMARAREKVAARGTPNVTLHDGDAVRLPFPDATFDLIVSNLGVNNIENREAAIRECRRVARSGAAIALTTNLQGHMREFYDVFAEVVHGEDRDRLQANIEHRLTIPIVRALLEGGGFRVARVVERTGRMRFANGAALFNHHFVKLGFLQGWKDVAPGREREIFAKLTERLRGEMALTIPMAYFEGRAV